MIRSKNISKYLLASFILLVILLSGLASPASLYTRAGQDAGSSAIDLARRVTAAETPIIDLQPVGSEAMESVVAEGLFPGDRVSYLYRLRAEHSGDLDLFFDIEILDTEAALTEVMYMRVEIDALEDPLYDGLIADWGDDLQSSLAVNNDSLSELIYRIEFYLDTAADNRYMDESLTLNLIWRAEGEDVIILPPVTPAPIPNTGLSRDPFTYLGLALVLAALIIFFFIIKNRKKEKTKTFTASLLSLFILCSALAVTTLAYSSGRIQIPGLRLSTGTIEINLNDTQAIFQNNDELLAVGQPIESDFFVENSGSGAFYYKLYFDEVSGELADWIYVSILDGEEELFVAPILAMNEESAKPLFYLEAGEKKQLTAVLTLAEEADNDLQSADLSFRFFAGATQAKNNPERRFD